MELLPCDEVISSGYLNRLQGKILWSCRISSNQIYERKQKLQRGMCRYLKFLRVDHFKRTYLPSHY